ncbi:hypothetical protein ACPZ19_19290 [Amycolatopsis lurida]
MSLRHGQEIDFCTPVDSREIPEGVVEKITAAGGRAFSFAADLAEPDNISSGATRVAIPDIIGYTMTK